MAADLGLQLGVALVGMASFASFVAHRRSRAPLPRIFSGANARVRSALQRCASLQRPYVPTLWCSSAHLQFLLFMWKCGADANRAPWQDELFTLSDSQRLRLRWVRPQAPPKGVVVLLHGILGSSGDYALLAASLAELGYASVGMDRRGHGLPLTVPRRAGGAPARRRACAATVAH